MKYFCIPDVTDEELVGFHVHLMRLWDRAQSGKMSCSGIGYSMIDRLLKATIKEINKRRINTTDDRFKK